MQVDPWMWAAFVAFILAMLALDLFVLHRDAHEVSFKEAAIWSGVWISLGLAFGALIWAWQGPQLAGQYYAGYLIEKSLSVDNVFVFALVFSYFAVPMRYQHRVLFWGVLGALVFRAIFIAAGAALLHEFHWMIYVFGAFLVFTGIKMWRSRDVHMDPGKNPVLRMMRRVVRITPDYVGQKMLLRDAGRLDRDAAARRARGDRDERHHVRGRLDPGDLRRHRRAVHRVHVERVRDPGAASAVLPAGRDDGPVRLPEAGAGRGAGVRRREDAAHGHLEGADLAEPAGDRLADRRLDPVVASAGSRRGGGGARRDARAQPA